MGDELRQLPVPCIWAVKSCRSRLRQPRLNHL